MTPATPSDFDISGSEPVPADAVPASMGSDAAACQANQERMSVNVSGDTIAVTVALDLSNQGVASLNEWASSVPSQGTHKWLALDIDTGTDDITKIKYNGEALTSVDVAEAAQWGLGAGHIILWLKAEEVKTTPKTIILSGDDYNTKTVTITVADATAG